MQRIAIGLIALCAVFYSCQADDTNPMAEESAMQDKPYQTDENNRILLDQLGEGLDAAVLAGGCFWCIESPYEKKQIEGIVAAVSGYTGGDEVNPKYEEVASGQTGHVEAVVVIYKPEIITYSEVLDIFWRQIDPTDAGGQFADRGHHYTTAIYYRNDEQKTAAEASKKALAESGKFADPIVTRIEAAKPFYIAEDYHQNYFKTNPARYNSYHTLSGRGPFIKQTWGED